MTLHITNGDSAAGGIRAVDGTGEILPWRDILHDGPVPSGLSLADLSRVRAKFLGSEGFGDSDELQRDLDERDDTLRRYSDYDQVVLWFEWDLYDQLQLIQILDFFSSASREAREETNTKLSIICIEGCLGNLNVDGFADLYEARRDVSDEMLALGRDAWKAFRSDDPRAVERLIAGDTSALEFLAGAMKRELEELPSTHNGLSRAESQILETIAQGPLTFSEIFKRVANREERIYCGDASMARYIERMSLHPNPLLTYPSGDSIDAPRTEEDSRAFRNAEMCLTKAGSDVLRGDRDWISMGGSDRWLGGVHLNGSEVQWRWDTENTVVVESATSEPQ
ncbi:MAG: DUF1835 domain-containing protein [Gemmatimonadales bacterium]